MINGVNFQPGGMPGGDPAQPKPGQGSGVQEAIKVLSLRLPKVVGAQSAAPQALLQGSGAQGNRVDSVVQQVLARMMPTGQPPPSPPQMGGPSGQPGPMPSWPWTGGQPQQNQPWSPPPGFNPRIVVNPSMPSGDFTQGPDGRPTGGQPPAMIGELPPNFRPPVDLDRIGDILGGYQPDREDAPLF